MIKYLTNRKYRSLYNRMKAAEADIWGFEFQLFRVRNFRETIRQERERNVELLSLLEQKMEGAGKDEKDELQKQKTQVEAIVKNLEGALQRKDAEINGYHGEDGFHAGILETIAGLTDMVQEYKRFIKNV